MAVFFRPGDYLLYKCLLRESARSQGVSIRAYCLMPNHVHLIAAPERAESLALVFRSVHAHYAEIVNARRGWTGHLWQQRFASFPMDERHARAALSYVHENPVRAGLVDGACDWPWSSARHEHGFEVDELVDSSIPPLERTIVRDQGLDLQRFRSCSRTGRPLGSMDFVRDLERLLGRTLGPQRRGPKPRRSATKSGDLPESLEFGELSPN